MNTHKHVCPLCDYVYDEATGDPSQGVAAGTPFSQLPDTWRHPGCTVGKEMFETCTCAAARKNVRSEARAATSIVFANQRQVGAMPRIARAGHGPAPTTATLSMERSTR